MSATINGINGIANSELESIVKESQTKNAGIGYEKIAPPNSTGVKVIIVGAGFAGLACAIECKRKGHEVLILEKFRELKILGVSPVIICFVCMIDELTSYRTGDVSVDPE